MRTLVALVCLSLLSLTAWPSASAASPARSDLVVDRVTVKPSSVLPGKKIEIRAVVRNKGKRAAKATRTRIYLSKDAKLQKKKDTRLATVRTAKLKKGAKRKATRKVKLSAKVKPGKYRIIVCADATGRVRESREKNNCRASKKFTVRKATAPEPPKEPEPPKQPEQPAPPAPPNPSITYGEDPSLEVIEEYVAKGDAFWWPVSQPTTGREAAVVLEQASVVSERIGAAGGVLTVTTEGGDKLTLTVPPGALAGAVEIIATPLMRLEGTGGALAAYGLALEPEGLSFLEPAELTVVPATGGAARPAVGVMAQDDGKHTRPVQLDPDPGRLAMPVWHFSTAAIVVGDGASGFFTPDEFAASPEAEMGRLTQEVRDAALAGDDVDDGALAEQLGDQLEEHFATNLAPKLGQIQTSCEYALSSGAVAELLSYLRQWQLLDGGAPAGREEQITAAIRAALQNCMDEESEVCMTMDRERLARWTAVARQLALYSGEGTVPPLDWCYNLNGTWELTVENEFPVLGGTGFRSRTVTAGISVDTQMSWLGDELHLVGLALIGRGSAHLELKGTGLSKGVTAAYTRTERTRYSGRATVPGTPGLVANLSRGTGTVSFDHRFPNGWRSDYVMVNDDGEVTTGSESSDMWIDDVDTEWSWDAESARIGVWGHRVDDHGNGRTTLTVIGSFGVAPPQ